MIAWLRELWEWLTEIPPGDDEPGDVELRRHISATVRIASKRVDPCPWITVERR